jgi:hypothetical protein
MDNKYRQYRFTVDSEHATIDAVDTSRYNWKLNMGHIIQNNSKVFMSIESIHSSTVLDLSHTDLGVIQDAAHEIAGDDIANCIIQLQNIMISQGNFKTHCYEIRCPNVVSRYVWDSNPNISTPVIYKGPLSLQNTNPKEAYIFEVSPDICNSDFNLHIYNNIRTDNDWHKFSITFILHEYRE